jgi:hypothetical protein
MFGAATANGQFCPFDYDFERFAVDFASANFASQILARA